MFFIFTLALSSCTSYIVKPNILYEDKALYRTIQNQKEKLIKQDSPKMIDINNLLNSYDTYVNKTHKTIQNNNKLAKGNKLI